MTQATTVAARGEAETAHNLVQFNLSLSATASTVPSAKAKLKLKVDGLQAAVEQMQKDLSLKFVKNSVRASSNVQEQYQWNDKTRQQDFTGYLASYSFSFQIDDLEHTSKVYDTLTSQEEVTVSAPSFLLKDATRQKVNAKALKHAKAKVTERFESECEILGLRADDFEIVSWEVTYSDGSRSSRVGHATRASMAGGARALAAAAPVAVAYAADDAGSDAIEIVVGQAVVTVNLEVGFARRANSHPQTVKAEVVRAASASTTGATA